MVTSATAWREVRNKGVEITLPQFGDVVAIRPMDVEFFVRTGRIPLFLTETVQKIIHGENYEMEIPHDAEKTKEWLTWLNELVTFAFVSPKVVSDPRADDEISIDEISYEDKLFIYRFFGRPAATLRRFHTKQAEPVAALDAAKNNGTSPQPDAQYPTLVKPDARNA